MGLAASKDEDIHNGEGAVPCRIDYRQLNLRQPRDRFPGGDGQLLRARIQSYHQIFRRDKGPDQGVVRIVVDDEIV